MRGDEAIRWGAASRSFRPGRPATHLLLFAATVISVFVATSPYNPLAIFGTQSALEGAVFTCAIMAILLAHELGHYLIGRRHGLDLTLPYFIPIPFAFGTMGAVIRMKSIDRRRMLMDVGAAGPLAGMAVALPIAVAGIALSDVAPIPATHGTIILGDSLLFQGLVALIHGTPPEGYDLFLHPLGLAAWFGFLVTALNLMPVSQLDGGHVVKALFGRHHLLISRSIFLLLSCWGALGDAVLGEWRLAPTGLVYVAAAIMVLTGRFRWISPKVLLVLFLAHLAMVMHMETETVLISYHWMLWSVLLYTFRLEHPPVRDPDLPLGPWRHAMGWLTIGIFVLTFMPVPITTLP